MSLILNGTENDSGLHDALQTLLDSRSGFGDSGASAAAAESRSETALRKGALTKLQRAMQQQDEQDASNAEAARLMGQVQAASQPSMADVGQPQPGQIGPPSLETQDERAAQAQLGQKHALFLSQAGNLAAKGHMSPQETGLMFRELMQPMAEEQQRLQQTQVADRIGRMGITGAFGDPASPQTQATIARLGQIALLNPTQALVEAGKEAAPYTKQVVQQTIRAQRVAIATKDAESITGYTGQNMPPGMVSDLHELATDQGDSDANWARWNAYGKYGQRPVPDANGKPVGIKYGEADKFQADQMAIRNQMEQSVIASKNATVETATARLENAQNRLEIARMKAEQDKENATFSNQLKAAQTNLEAAKTNYQNTLNDLAEKGRKPSGLPSKEERAGVFSELLKANPGLGSQDEATQNEAVDRAMRVRSGQSLPLAGQAKNEMDFGQTIRDVAPFVSPALGVMKALGKGPYAKAEKPAKPDRVKQLVQEGKSDEEIKAAIKKEYP